MTISGSLLSLDGRDSKLLINVALGQEKADLAIVNARLLNVYTGELIDDFSVSIKGKWIAYVGDDPKDTIGPKTTVIDARGKTLIPGLIDGHTHIDSLFNISEFLKYAMKGGTTTIITETMETYPIMGHEGVLEFLESIKDQPIKIFGTAPAMTSTSRVLQGIPIETAKKLLARPDIVGLGESYWQVVLQEPDLMLPTLDETLRHGKILEGHSAGARGKKLMAYVAAGISSCHEPITAGEVRERLRLGLHVMVREGSIRRDLEAVAEIKDEGIDLRRLTLVTDGVDPRGLMEDGCMEFVVQKAIDYGFDPITAVQMATLNVAEHFSLDSVIGGIAPGRYADLLIIPDPATISAEYVISNGQIIAQNGNLLISPRQYRFSEKSRNSVHLPRAMETFDFAIRAEGGYSSVEVRIIELITDLVTKELRVKLPVVDGEVKPDENRDILKVAAIDRTHSPGKTFVGLVKGFRMKSGAIASSATWDTSDIIVVGASDPDMAAAVNRVFALQGGSVICANGKILAELPLPVLGLISDDPMEKIVQKTEAIKNAAADLGVPFADPLLTLNTLTTAAIPYLRICEQGLVNLKDGKTVGLIVN